MTDITSSKDNIGESFGKLLHTVFEYHRGRAAQIVPGGVLWEGKVWEPQAWRLEIDTRIWASKMALENSIYKP